MMTIWICLFVTIWVAILSHSNIKITIAHKYDIEQEDALDPEDIKAQQKALEEYYEKEKTLPSFDDVLKEVQDILRGDTDEE